MRFEFATATRIVFGAGTVKEVAPAAARLGRRALLVTGRNWERARLLRLSLEEAALSPVVTSIDREPTIEMVREAAQLARRHGCDVVIAQGGGSAIDAGKAIAALITNDGDPLDYLEVIGEGRKLGKPAAPFLAVPTTSGTGAEVTRNAVLASLEHRVKASLRSPFLLPAVAVVDPELTLDLPGSVTAATGMDALTQLIEPYVSSRANPMSDLFCREGIRRVARSLAVAFRNGGGVKARTDMAFASLLGGLALANAGLGVVHGFAAPVGGMFPAPHGAVCAALLAVGMEVNIRALRARVPESEALERYAEVARLLTGSGKATAEDGVAWVERLRKELGIPGLRAHGVKEQNAGPLVEKAARASSMKANPVRLTEEELREVLTRAL